MSEIHPNRRQILLGFAAALAATRLPTLSARAQGKEARIGYQKGGVSLTVLKAQGDFQKRLEDLGYTVTWTEFQAGVPMLAGTDGPGIPGMIPGVAIHDDIAILRSLGMTPFEALATATSNAGRFITSRDGDGRRASRPARGRGRSASGPNDVACSRLDHPPGPRLLGGATGLDPPLDGSKKSAGATLSSPASTLRKMISST